MRAYTTAICLEIHHRSCCLHSQVYPKFPLFSSDIFWRLPDTSAEDTQDPSGSYLPPDNIEEADMSYKKAEFCAHT